MDSQPQLLAGVAAALGSAFLWASTNLLVRMEAHRVSVVAFNAYRTIVGALLFAVVFLVAGNATRVANARPIALAALLGSVVVGLVIGDTLNFRAMTYIGLARSFPISGSFPLFTLVFAAVFLQETIGWREVAGCVVTLAGVMLVARRDAATSEAHPTDGRRNTLGVAFALTAAVMWALSSTVVKIGLADLDAVSANAVRLPVASVILLIMTRATGHVTPPWRLPRRTAIVIIAAGLLGSGLSGYLWIESVNLIGVARAAVLTATSPIFAAPLSYLILKERLTIRVLLGTLLSVGGIALMMSANVL